MKAETGDVVQDALIQFLRYGPRFELDDDVRVRALLARIVENVLRDKVDWFTAQRRTVARERPLPPDSILGLNDSVRVSESTSRVVEKREAEARIRLALELIDPGVRSFIVGYDWEGLSFADLGQRHDISKSEARRRYLRSSRLLVECVRSLKEGRFEDILDESSP